MILTKDVTTATSLVSLVSIIYPSLDRVTDANCDVSCMKQTTEHMFGFYFSRNGRLHRLMKKTPSAINKTFSLDGKKYPTV